MKNIRITIEYDGTSFAGWQRQSGGIITIQGEIEVALGRILQEKISLAAAGRTDKGVHAREQTANFVTVSSMEPARIVHSLNCLLPDTIRISNPTEVPEDFHARHRPKRGVIVIFSLRSLQRFMAGLRVVHLESLILLLCRRLPVC